MKAIELSKKSVSVDEIYNEIENITKNSENNIYKHCIPHWIYVSDDVKSRLITDGFKISQGEWMHGDKGLIIEW